MEPGDPTEAVLDDVFVLWRAFESTAEPAADLSLNQHTRRAVTAAINHVSVQRLNGVREFAKNLKYVARATLDEVFQLFGDQGADKIELKERLSRTGQRLHDSVVPDVRWTDRESRDLAGIMYACRCSIIHSSLDTDSRLADVILRPLRSATIELVIAHWAFLAVTGYDDALAAFADE